MHPREEQPVDRSHVTVATQHRTAEHSRTTAGQLQRDPQTTILLLSCSQACPTIVASPTNAHVHRGVAQHINLILECADASIDNTLADPPDCPKAPCPSFSSMNDGLTASPLACLSRNQQSSNVLSSHRGAHGHTRDLMTSLGPCKSKTADPTSRALGGGRASELARLQDAARRIEPIATALKRGGFPRPWFRKVPPHPSCARQAVQPSLPAWSGCLRRGAPGEGYRLPFDASCCLNSSFCHRTDSRTTFLLSFRSFIHHISFFLSSLAVIKVICLIQDMSYRNSKACDAGLAFDFARTLGPTAADGGWPPDHCHALAFPAHQ